MIGTIEAHDILKQIAYKPNFTLKWKWKDEGRIIKLWWEHERPDAITGEMGTGVGGPDYFELAEMTEEAIVRVAFANALALEEHECREFLTYKGLRVFNPHTSLIEYAQLIEFTKKELGDSPTDEKAS